jgi:hypothetical protein
MSGTSRFEKAEATERTGAAATTERRSDTHMTFDI